PYFDLGGGNIWMVTWSAPFFDEAGNVKGVATADIAFSQVQELVKQISVGDKGYAFLLDSKGKILGIGEDAGGYYEPM
ncbi:cache domain-containing protein, partial [bacterium]|nr:cache domain-containing protein [bacterium]